ncbi:MAG: NAD(P)H-hydrate dehydratase [Bacteroidetes bacterium]|nr:NAD(P)H-hydrate dehydratase [Bacteroidota bacterium]
MNKVETTWETIEPEMLSQIYVPKREFSHKGNYGHSLLITGSHGKMGASVLMAKGYLKGGGGLLTTMVPEKEGVILQTTVPESMVVSMQTANELDWAKFQVIGIGPGLSTSTEMSNLLELVLSKHSGKMVLDADALNLLAQKPELLAKLPENAILTPHPVNFAGWLAVAKRFPENGNAAAIQHQTPIGSYPERKKYRHCHPNRQNLV